VAGGLRDEADEQEVEHGDAADEHDRLDLGPVAAHVAGGVELRAERPVAEAEQPGQAAVDHEGVGVAEQRVLELAAQRRHPAGAAPGDLVNHGGS
jgi:hypothetical protein